MLGKLAVPGRPTIWIRVGQGPTAGEGCFNIFTLDNPSLLFYLSLGNGPI